MRVTDRDIELLENSSVRKICAVTAAKIEQMPLQIARLSRLQRRPGKPYEKPKLENLSHGLGDEFVSGGGVGVTV